MSEDQDKDSKTEDPTGKRITDTIEKGNLPISREAPIFASALAFYVFLVFFAPQGAGRLVETLRDLFEKPEQWDLNNSTDVVSLLSHLVWEASAVLMPAFLLAITFAIAANALQYMPRFVLERIRPQISRLSLTKGLGRIFSVTGLVEFGKSLLKIVLLGIVMGFVLKADYFSALDAMFTDPQAIFIKIAAILKTAMLVVLVFTAILAIIDIAWTRYKWFDNLRMTKQEVKDEHKQTQGDPIVKSRQRSIARDRARRRMINNVPRATLVITNPTHFAIALRYNRAESDAPVVVAKGQDLIALKIREIAQQNNIPVFEDPPLARSMYAQVRIDGVIPAPFYKAVAELIHRVYKSKTTKRRRA